MSRSVLFDFRDGSFVQDVSEWDRHLGPGGGERALDTLLELGAAVEVVEGLYQLAPDGVER
jgi:hypothetical protein